MHLEICCCLFCLVLFHVYPPVTRKRWWRRMLNESATRLSIAVGEQSSLGGGARWICPNVQTKIFPNVQKFPPFILIGLGWSLIKKAFTKIRCQNNFTFARIYFNKRGEGANVPPAAMPMRLEVIHFQVFLLFFWLLTTKFAACSKPPSRDNHRKAPYSRTQQLVRWGWELNLNHAIVITRSP